MPTGLTYSSYQCSPFLGLTFMITSFPCLKCHESQHGMAYTNHPPATLPRELLGWFSVTLGFIRRKHLTSSFCRCPPSKKLRYMRTITRRNNEVSPLYSEDVRHFPSVSISAAPSTYPSDPALSALLKRLRQRVPGSYVVI